MYSHVHSASLIGLDACDVSIEIDISRGIPQIIIVGLPDAAVNEARERVKSAIKASGLELPLGRIVVNMAPADLRKEGSHYDLAIAVGILISAGQLKTIPHNVWLIGELALNGDLRSVNGVLAIASSAKELGVKHIIVPAHNAKEAALIEGITVYKVQNIIEAREILNAIASENISEAIHQKYHEPTYDFSPEDYIDYLHDIRYAKGQYQAKRALEIAAAGGHNILFIGDPGCGKSMLAQCLPSIMPPLTKEMALETTKIYSVAGMLDNSELPIITKRPFRSPHHSISAAGLIGGGSTPRPGEISLSHNGVLFLDELAEFDKKTLDNLRQPIETGHVHISRVRFSVQFPSRFMLVGACNPTQGTSKKSNNLIISAPLWDRFGLVVWVPPLKSDDLIDFDPNQNISSADIRRRVMRAWEAQKARYEPDHKVTANAHMSSKQIREYCTLSKEAKSLLEYAAMELELTGRTYDHVLRVARTIADLDAYDEIEDEHIAESIQYRISQDAILAMTNTKR